MKNRSAVVKSSFLFGLFIGFVHASGSYGVVTALKGRGFGVHDEKTFILKVGQKLPQKTDIITEEGAQVSFIDFYERKYNLTGAAHVKVRDHVLKLNRGYLWVKSFQKNKKLRIMTANSLTEFLSGEGIISFDNGNGRSQLLAIKGELKFAHILDVNSYEVLQPGEFSSIDHESGILLRAALIGFESYEKIISLFRTSHVGDSRKSKFVIRPSSKKKAERRFMKNKNRPKRLLASSRAPQHKGGSIPVIKTKWTTKQLENLSSDLKNLYLSQLKGVSRPSKRKKAKKIQENPQVRVRIFGGERQRVVSGRGAAFSVDQRPRVLSHSLGYKKGPKTREKRAMVKLKRIQRAPTSQEKKGPSSWGIEASLRKHLKKTSRHKLESSGFIEEIRGHRQGYKFNY